MSHLYDEIKDPIRQPMKEDLSNHQRTLPTNVQPSGYVFNRFKVDHDDVHNQTGLQKDSAYNSNDGNYSK